MKTFELKVTMKVADSWIADGFNANERTEQIQEMLTGLLPYASENEFVIEVKVTKSPTGETISDLQDGTVEAKD